MEICLYFVNQILRIFNEAIYLHVLGYAANNAWYVYRYDLFDYFNENHIPIPAFSIDSDGFMTHPVTGQRLCPL